MIIDTKNKFIFVAIAKTACTSIHARLGGLHGRVACKQCNHPPNRAPLPYIYHMFLKDIVRNHPETKNFYKFAFVRNPYDRLVSAYHDFKHNSEHKNWAHPIYKYNSFRDFVMDFENSPCVNFIHLQPQFDYLETEGQINIDFIGRFENLREDFRKIEKELSLPHIDLPVTRVSKHKDYHHYYDEETKLIVRRIYKNDFEIFGYEK